MASGDDPWPELAKYSTCAHSTADAVTRALEGFPIQTDKDPRWLAAACRRAFFSNVGGYADDHPGTRIVRNELIAIRDSLTALSAQLDGRSDFAESVFRRFAAFNDFEPIGETDASDLAAESLKDWRVGGSNYLRSLSADWREFCDAVNGISHLENYVSGAIDKLCSRSDPPRWRDVERRKERIGFAVWLSAIFEAAYAKPATVNNWCDSEGNTRFAPWPDFFSRVACMALKLSKIPDLSGVLKASRKQYVKGAGVILPSTFLKELHP